MARPKNKQRFRWNEKTYSSGNKYYSVDGYKLDGTRVREKYKRRVDAINRVSELDSDNSTQDRQLKATSLNDAQLADAETAIKQLEGELLSEIISHYKQLQERIKNVADVNLETAVTFFEKHYTPHIKEISIYTASSEFLESKGPRSVETIKYYSKCLNLIKKADPNKALHRFTESDIMSALKPYLKTGAAKTYRRGLSVFFNWAKRRRYILESPFERMDALETNERDIVIFTLDDVKQILNAARLYENGMMASSIAILLFAGLRPSELEDLTAQDVKDDWIVVSGGKRGGKLKRRTPIPPVLRTWLNEFPFTGRPKTWYRRMAKLKSAAQPSQWVSDIFRHTSISYQIERDEDMAAVAIRNGTSVQMIELHYRDVIEDPKDCTEFWELTPNEIETVELKGELKQQEFIEWPSDDELKKLVWKSPLTHLAKTLGVTNSAIRKRCIKHKIELPKNGHWQRVSQENRKQECNQ